jgi:hypothetical protein
VAAWSDVTAGLRLRTAAMVERVALEATAALGAGPAAVVRDAVEAALQHRDGRLDDDHDPRLLHPARSILILLSDTDCRCAGVLAAAAFVESVDRELAASPQALLRCAGRDAMAIAAAAPLPGDDDEMLLERLVSSGEAAALVALAERLDQARHLHLRPELPWLSFHEGIERVYVPAARRLSLPLARRFERWAEAFRRRLALRAELE